MSAREQRVSHYDSVSAGWQGIEKRTAVEVIQESEPDDVTCRKAQLEKEKEILRERQKDVWKTLVRYVWHNATSVSEACAFFGHAALHVDLWFARWMRAEEVAALKAGNACVAAVMRFSKRAVYAQTWRPLAGYSPLSSLLCGELGQWVQDTEEQLKRREALRVIFTAAWMDLGKKGQCSKKANSLRVAFVNFAAITAEDRDLLAWVTQTEFGKAFAETRAAVCARRNRKVRASLSAMGYQQITAPGGKSEASRKTYAEVQKGNHNRRGISDEERETQVAEARQWRAEHGDIPVRKDLPRDPVKLREFLKKLARDAEEKRLERVFGSGMKGCEIEKTLPKEKV